MKSAPDEVFSVALPLQDVSPADAATASRLGRPLYTAPHGIPAETAPYLRPPAP